MLFSSEQSKQGPTLSSSYIVSTFAALKLQNRCFLLSLFAACLGWVSWKLQFAAFSALWLCPHSTSYCAHCKRISQWLETRFTLRLHHFNIHQLKTDSVPWKQGTKAEDLMSGHMGIIKIVKPRVVVLISRYCCISWDKTCVVVALQAHTLTLSSRYTVVCLSYTTWFVTQPIS